MYCGFFPANMIKTTGKIVSVDGYDKVSFEYYVENKPYSSSRASCGRVECQGSQLKLQLNQVVDVYYNGRIPSFGVLSPSYKMADFKLVIGIFILLIFLIGIVIYKEEKVAEELFFNN